MPGFGSRRQDTPEPGTELWPVHRKQGLPQGWGTFHTQCGPVPFDFKNLPGSKHIIPSSSFFWPTPPPPTPECQNGERVRSRALVKSADGFAQVFPEHKFLIVETYKGMGYKTGMTGDGVVPGVAFMSKLPGQHPGANDAPALKAADVGPSGPCPTPLLFLSVRISKDFELTEPFRKPQLCSSPPPFFCPSSCLSIIFTITPSFKLFPLRSTPCHTPISEWRFFGGGVGLCLDILALLCNPATPKTVLSLPLRN